MTLDKATPHVSQDAEGRGDCAHERCGEGSEERARSDSGETSTHAGAPILLPNTGVSCYCGHSGLKDEDYLPRRKSAVGPESRSRDVACRMKVQKIAGVYTGIFETFLATLKVGAGPEPTSDEKWAPP